jgi:hypothetical protein
LATSRQRAPSGNAHRFAVTQNVAESSAAASAAQRPIAPFHFNLPLFRSKLAKVKTDL